jgi:DegV family protein with EDD domain
VPVRVVTDSTSDLPRELAQSMGIEIVPLKVRFGTEEFRDGVDLSAGAFYGRLINSSELPTTSQPSVGDFVEAYERVGQDAEGIVSVHVSSRVSGTHNAALQAREQASVNCPIEVIDTLQASMGIGVVALAASRAVQAGGDLNKVAEVARQAIGKCQCFALFDTLEYLEKGGRIGKARALVATLLSIKPMIILREGEVHELAKERTRKRGITRLEQAATDFAPIADMAVMYSTNLDDADALAERLATLMPEGRKPIVAQFGPVIGTYVGPNALGVGLLRA